MKKLADKFPVAKMTPDDEIRLGGTLFDLAHGIETKFGLAGVRYMKRWCVEKLPEKAFDRGHFESES